MRLGRYVSTCAVLLVVALGWNALVHLVLLRSLRARVQHLFRADVSSYAWLSLVVTAGMICLFVWGYGRFCRDASRAEAARYALFFGLVAGLLVDLNQVVLYPIPFGVAFTWFAFGMVEFQLYATLLRWLLPPAAARLLAGDDASGAS